jgi:hypothetical protein
VSGALLGDLLKELEVHRTYLTAVGRFCRDAGARSDNRNVRIEIGNLWHNLNFHAAVIERVEQIDARREQSNFALGIAVPYELQPVLRLQQTAAEQMDCQGSTDRAGSAEYPYRNRHDHPGLYGNSPGPV